MKELVMSAIEFALKPQSCIDGLSLVPSEKPSTEAFIARYEKLTKSRTQSELDRTSARMNLLAEITGFLAGDARLETFLIQLTTRIRLVMASDLVLLGLY